MHLVENCRFFTNKIRVNFWRRNFRENKIPYLAWSPLHLLSTQFSSFHYLSVWKKKSWSFLVKFSEKETKMVTQKMYCKCMFFSQLSWGMHKKMPNKKLASDYNKNPQARDILAARRRTKSTKNWRRMALHSFHLLYSSSGRSPSSLSSSSKSSRSGRLPPEKRPRGACNKNIDLQ